MTRVPIACSLEVEAVPDQLEKWRALLADRVVESQRRDGLARLRLRDDDASLTEAVRLARAEHACCAFLSFSIEIEADGLWLTVAAPEEADVVLDALFGEVVSPR